MCRFSNKKYLIYRNYKKLDIAIYLYFIIFNTKYGSLVYKCMVFFLFALMTIGSFLIMVTKLACPGRISNLPALFADDTLCADPFPDTLLCITNRYRKLLFLRLLHASTLGLPTSRSFVVPIYINFSGGTASNFLQYRLDIRYHICATHTYTRKSRLLFSSDG